MVLPGQYSEAKAASQRDVRLYPEMRVTITCEECGERHRLERQVSEPGPIWIVCHNCELPLQAVLDAPAVRPGAPASPRPASTLWAGAFDMSSDPSAA